MGKAPEKILRIAEIIKEGLNSVLDRVKPGVSGHDLEEVWKKVISKYNIEKDSRIGYPVGIGYPPTWGELTLSLRKADKNIIHENIVIKRTLFLYGYFTHKRGIALLRSRVFFCDKIIQADRKRQVKSLGTIL